MNLSRIASFNKETGPHVGMLAIVGFIFVICMLTVPVKDRSDSYLSQSDIARLYPPSGQIDAEQRLQLKEVFDERLRHYEALLSSMNANLFYQIIFSAAALLMLTHTGVSLTVPVLNQKIPLSMVCIGLPLCLGYLWLEFGFIFHEVIDSRMVLWKVGETMEPAFEALREDEPTWNRLIYTFSQRPLADDGGLLDGWFMLFRERYTYSIVKPGTLVFIIFGLFGALLGISNGSMLGAVIYRWRRFSDPKHGAMVHACVLWLGVIVIFMSHFTFYWLGQNPNWVQPVAIGVSVVTTALFAWTPLPAAGPKAA